MLNCDISPSTRFMVGFDSSTMVEASDRTFTILAQIVITMSIEGLLDHYMENILNKVKPQI